MAMSSLYSVIAHVVMSKFPTFVDDWVKILHKNNYSTLTICISDDKKRELCNLLFAFDHHSLMETKFEASA